MHYISKAEDWVISLYPENSDNCNFKISDYAMIEPYLDGYIVFHTITWSQYFLDNNEYGSILSNDILKKNKVVVDENINEEPIAEEVYIKRSQRDIDHPYSLISSYTILTTNTCNANCSYCFETIKTGDMSIDTANLVCDFIEKKTKEYQQIRLNWFGGEPLKNHQIISYITKILKEKNVNFYSEIVTNGSLFNNDILEKAINEWNLSLIQVTIDGPEDFYNDIKNYDETYGKSPFKTVINNMLNVAQNSSIRIEIRINISPDNIEYADKLINEINYYFSGTTNVSTYLAILYQVRNYESVKNVCEFYEQVNKFRNRHPQNFNIDLFKKESLARCMADKCRGLTIGIDGKLYNCEHIRNESFVGDVVNGITENEKVKDTIEKGGRHIENCRLLKCKLLPICSCISICPPAFKCKNEKHVELEKYKTIIRLKNNVDYYLKSIRENKKIGED